MSGIDLPSDQAAKKAIDLDEGFFLALASTAMHELIPDYRRQFGIDAGLSAYAAAAIVSARTIASEYDFQASARRLGAILETFFDEEIAEWFEEEVNTILRECGVDPENFQHFWPARADLNDAAMMDFDHLIAEADRRGWARFGGALAPALRLYWEEQLQVTL